MNDQMIELGRRAIAAGFGYPPGSVWRDTDGRKYACMRSNGDGRAIMQPMDGGWSQCVSALDNEWMRPDLSDPATLGCLLAQVRERWGGIGSGVVAIIPHRLRWAMMTCGQMDDAISGDSEAAALVAALEAAPKSAG